MTDSDSLLEGDWFAAEDDAPAAGSPPADAEPWKILIVDDDSQVHDVTRLVLSGTVCRDRRLAFFSAFSVPEARALLQRHDDIAVILLDVVMETDDAGLEVARFTRSELGNDRVRIILRTGQPGRAPERRVVDDYDINDYRAKSELTADRLYTATITALRAYDCIVGIERNRQGLKSIIEHAPALLRERAMRRFAEGVLTRLAALAGAPGDGVLCLPEDGTAVRNGGIVVAGAIGHYAGAAGSRLDAAVGEPAAAAIVAAFAGRRSLFDRQQMVLHIPTPAGGAAVALLRVTRVLGAAERDSLELFGATIASGFDTIEHYQKLQQDCARLQQAGAAFVPGGSAAGGNGGDTSSRDPGLALLSGDIARALDDPVVVEALQTALARRAAVA